MPQIVAYIKDSQGRKYKIEKYRGYKTFISDADYYRVLYENGDVYARDFTSYNEAVRYLEKRVGNTREY